MAVTPWLLAGIVALLGIPERAAAQTDFYNTDRGRPVQIEDAYATERHSFELKLAPVRLQRTNGGSYNWGLEPELSYGILPRTEVQVGLPLAYAEYGATRRGGIAGVEFSALHNFNVETESWPALGLRADVLAPVGNLRLAHTYTSVTGIATRTGSWARIHLNGQYTAGPASASRAGGSAAVAGPGAIDVSRWLVGGAIDKTFPLSAYLITAEFFGRKPLISTEKMEYTVGSGIRYQQSPTLALDGGLGRRLNGREPGWYVTFGTAYSFGVRSLMPFGR